MVLYTQYPKELSLIKSVFDWEEYPLDFKEKWYDYIDKEFTRREEGFWFINKGIPTYITGTNYMYLQWSPRLMSGNRTFGNQTDYSIYSGRLVNLTIRSYGMCYLKNTEDPAFRLCPQLGRSVNQATISTDATIWYTLQSLDPMQRKCLLTKLSQYRSTIHFSSNRYRMGWTGPRRSLLIESQPPSLPEENLIQMKPKLQEITGLGHNHRLEKHRRQLPMTGRSLNSLSTMNQGSGKGPTNILNNWRVTKNLVYD